MERAIGFSTGSLGRSDFGWAVNILNRVDVSAVELSALRFHELEPLIKAIDTLDLKQFRYKSFHAPSKFDADQEKYVVKLLHQIKDRGWPIVVHPDVLHTSRLWKGLNGSLCIENMDIRKPVGRTCSELKQLFDIYTHSHLCFDIAHAKQIDGTMVEASRILKEFRGRIKQIHISDVDSQSVHHPINRVAMYSFQKVCDLIPSSVPLILESPTIDLDENVEWGEWIHGQMLAARHAVSYEPSELGRPIQAIKRERKKVSGV